MPLAVPIISSIIDIGSKIIDRIFPDPQAKAAAQLELYKLAQAGEFKQMEADLQLALAQVEVNKVEAGGNAFASSWRPAVGWCGVIGLLYTYLMQPLLAWYSTAIDIPAPPSLDLGDLLTLLAGLLGMSGMRTFERIKGVIPRGG